MKIRKGFISNSSSSSFIVAFPSRPESVAQLRKWMFEDAEKHMSEDKFYPTITIAEIIMNDIKDTNEEDVIQSIRDGWFGDYKNLPGYFDNWEEIAKVRRETENYNKKVNEMWREEREENDKRSRAIAKRFIKDNPCSFICVFEYGDRDGEFYSMMEHSEIFAKLPHIRTSYH